MKLALSVVIAFVLTVCSVAFAKPPQCKESDAPKGCFEKIVLPKSIAKSIATGKEITILPKNSNTQESTDKVVIEPKRQICSLRCDTFNVCDDKGHCHPEKICYRECSDVE